MFWALFTLVALAFVVSIARRVNPISDRLSDPSRLQRVFAESAAAALRRADAQPEPDTPTAPLRVRRTPVPRSEPISFEMGDHFRLSEPPEINEPHGPFATGANWIVFAVLATGAAY